MAEFYLSQQAHEDIDDVVSFIAQENQVAAEKFIDELFSSMEQLANNPELGHSRSDLTDKPVKFCHLNGVT